MAISKKLMLIGFAAAFGISQGADASISASLKSACEKAGDIEERKSDSTKLSQAYPSLLSSHFSASSCNGLVLLTADKAKQSRSEKVESTHDELVSSSD